MLDQLSGAKTHWRVTGQQALMAQLDQKQGAGKAFRSDGWDGYPAARQRILWSAEGGGKDLAWRLNGQVIAGGAAVDWMPWPGRHMIELLEGKQVVDRAAIEVRGAPRRRFSAR